MKKYLPLFISTIITTAFVVVKQSVLPALPGINRIINSCPNEIEGYKNQLFQPNDAQEKNHSRNRDSLSNFLFIRKYTLQNQQQQKHEAGDKFGYRLYGRIILLNTGNPSSQK